MKKYSKLMILCAFFAYDLLNTLIYHAPLNLFLRMIRSGAEIAVGILGAYLIALCIHDYTPKLFKHSKTPIWLRFIISAMLSLIIYGSFRVTARGLAYLCLGRLDDLGAGMYSIFYSLFKFSGIDFYYHSTYHDSFLLSLLYNFRYALNTFFWREAKLLAIICAFLEVQGFHVKKYDFHPLSLVAKDNEFLKTILNSNITLAWLNKDAAFLLFITLAIPMIAYYFYFTLNSILLFTTSMTIIFYYTGMLLKVILLGPGYYVIMNGNLVQNNHLIENPYSIHDHDKKAIQKAIIFGLLTFIILALQHHFTSFRLTIFVYFYVVITLVLALTSILKKQHLFELSYQELIIPLAVLAFFAAYIY